MKKFIKNWLLGVGAGVCISLGTVTYLLISNKLLGAFVFAFGLFLVCTYKLKLCTGMAGYLFSKFSTEGFVAATIGNVNGISLMYWLFSCWNPEVKSVSYELFTSKMNLMPHQFFISAMLCGMLMFLAVDIYKYGPEESMMHRLFGLFLAVPCFVLNGFDHCIVTIFYINSATSIEEAAIGLQIFSTVMIGNFIGAMLAYLLFNKVNYWRIKNDSNQRKRF